MEPVSKCLANKAVQTKQKGVIINRQPNDRYIAIFRGIKTPGAFLFYSLDNTPI